MRQMAAIVAVCFAIAAATAQTAEIKVSYTALSPNFRNGDVDIKNHYVLIANSTYSKFFSPVTEYIDSLNSTPEGMAKWNEMTRAAASRGDFDDMPRKDGSYYIVKSADENNLRYYDSAGIEKYYYDEQPEELSWEISDTTKNLLGYECVEATADYHGRKWNLWFTPDIPVANGPWKFGGLPGLILEASTEDGKYSFTATGIQQTTESIGPVYLADSYEKTDRKSFLKAKRAFLDNPLGSINALMGGEIEISGEAAEPIYASRDIVDLIETDY